MRFCQLTAPRSLHVTDTNLFQSWFVRFPTGSKPCTVDRPTPLLWLRRCEDRRAYTVPGEDHLTSQVLQQVWLVLQHFCCAHHPQTSEALQHTKGVMETSGNLCGDPANTSVKGTVLTRSASQICLLGNPRTLSLRWSWEAQRSRSIEDPAGQGRWELTWT